MRTLKLALIVGATLSLTACSWTQSMLQTVPRPVPEACLKRCQPSPAPKDGSDYAIRQWEYDIIDTFGACRRLHDDCVEWHTKEK